MKGCEDECEVVLRDRRGWVYVVLRLEQRGHIKSHISAVFALVP